MNRYPLWKYLLIIAVIAVGCLFALPNLYGKDPALQVSASRGGEISELTRYAVEDALDTAGIEYGNISVAEGNLVARFRDEGTQLKAQDVVKEALGRSYTVALNLAPATPGWLRAISAEPMFLGLDLRGGVHFLMQVDMEAAVVKAEERYVSDIRTQLRDERIRYKTITRRRDGGLLVRFRDAEQRRLGITGIEDNFPDLELEQPESESGEFPMVARLSDDAVKETRRLALQQNITTLRKRVNELGVAEPIIQQQGLERVVVQLPGVQDTARAKEILGATATLEFRMTDEERSVQDALDGRAPAGSRLYYDRGGNPVLLKKQVMLTGDYIIDAAAGFDSVSGSPNVSITLDGKGAKRFSDATAEEVGRNMAVVFIENKTETGRGRRRNGKTPGNHRGSDQRGHDPGTTGQTLPDHRPGFHRRIPATWPCCCAPARWRRPSRSSRSAP